MLGEEMGNIESKDKNLNPIIYKILNECYHEFEEKYGNKHSAHIREMITNITDKVKKIDRYYDAPIAAAHVEKGIIYSESDELPAILKHELWHVFNENSFDPESYTYLPIRYKEVLETSGYIKQEYDKKMNEYKERWKSEPKRLQYLLVDYETFFKDYAIEDQETEKWTEWFSMKTHTQDMKNHFRDWGDGFYTKNLSSGSFYDCFTNIADMVSCLIPREKLLEMHLNTRNYKTEYSYQEMIDEFDERYPDALDEEEKQKYQYPYLKILMDTKSISENVIDNPDIARASLESCMKTCFMAYLQKLEGMQNLDINEAKTIFFEIKYMQEHMLWNIDQAKMENLEYVQVLHQVQDKFKEMLATIDRSNPEIQQMIENVDYRKENSFEKIENGEEIAQNILLEKNSDRTTIKNIGKYRTKVGKNGIKDNLYTSIKALFGKDIFNLLFKNFQGDTSFGKEGNELLNLYRMIESMANDDDVIHVYDYIYGLYAKKLKDTLKTNQNMGYSFKKYSEEIMSLQENGLLDVESGNYLPSLEQVISIYKSKAQEYCLNIDEATEITIQRQIMEQDRPEERIRESNNFFADSEKKSINMRLSNIDKKRDEQLLEYTEKDSIQASIKEGRTFSTEQIGKACFTGDKAITGSQMENSQKRMNSDLERMTNEEKEKQ